MSAHQFQQFKVGDRCRIISAPMAFFTPPPQYWPPSEDGAAFPFRFSPIEIVGSVVTLTDFQEGCWVFAEPVAYKCARVFIESAHGPYAFEMTATMGGIAPEHLALLGATLEAHGTLQ